MAMMIYPYQKGEIVKMTVEDGFQFGCGFWLASLVAGGLMFVATMLAATFIGGNILRALLTMIQ